MRPSARRPTISRPRSSSPLASIPCCRGRRKGAKRLAELAQPRAFRALLLGLSISVDALAIGFTLGLLRLPVGLVIAVIAVPTFVVTQLGLRLGDRISARLREGAERLAGVALPGLGIALLLETILL